MGIGRWVNGSYSIRKRKRYKNKIMKQNPLKNCNEAEETVKNNEVGTNLHIQIWAWILNNTDSVMGRVK